MNLYNLNNCKDNIRKIKKAIIFEGEKSALKYISYFGEENDLSVSICGSSMINYQAWLLIQQGAKEIIILQIIWIIILIIVGNLLVNKALKKVCIQGG